jgi:hypothetical protein
MRVTRVGDLETRRPTRLAATSHFSELSLPSPEHSSYTSFLPPPGEHGKNYVIRCAHPRGGANTHTHLYSLYSPGLLTRMREPAPQREKGTGVHNRPTSRAHVQGGQGEEGAKTVTSRT